MLLKVVPPGFAAVVMAIVVVVRGEMDLPGSGWSNECRRPLCGMAEKQAEGLARLRVLSDYIRETMNLMESVITSLDVEMMEVAEELRNAVGRRCYSRTLSSISNWNHSRQHESGNIIEVSSDSQETQSSTNGAQGSTSSMSEDVDTVLDDSYSTTQYTSQTQHSSSTTWPGSQRPSSTTWSGSQRPSSTTWSGSQLPSSTSQSSSTSHTTASHKTGKTSHSPDVSDKYEAQPSITTTTYVAPEEPESEEVGTWRGGSGRWQGGGRGHGGGRGQGAGHGGGRGQGAGHGGGRGWGHGRGRNQNRAYEEPAPVEPQRSGCRGVPVGSPHYIPGLDSWCKTNCPLGNCPQTHCIC